MATGRFVAYLRVSTQRQGASGLGLDAQRKAILDHLNGGSWQLAAEFVEVESGKRNDRPELVKALAGTVKLANPTLNSPSTKAGKGAECLATFRP
jgi:hypothetical protein